MVICINCTCHLALLEVNHVHGKHWLVTRNRQCLNTSEDRDLLQLAFVGARPVVAVGNSHIITGEWWNDDRPESQVY